MYFTPMFPLHTLGRHEKTADFLMFSAVLRKRVLKNLETDSFKYKVFCESGLAKSNLPICIYQLSSCIFCITVVVGCFFFVVVVLVNLFI